MRPRACWHCTASLSGSLPSFHLIYDRFMQHNMLFSLEGVGAAPLLDTLNVCHNYLPSLDHVAGCPNLTTLLASNNHLETCESIKPILGCPSLMTLDLQENKLDDPKVPRLSVFADRWPLSVCCPTRASLEGKCSPLQSLACSIIPMFFQTMGNSVALLNPISLILDRPTDCPD
jgi:Leucine-rich repeat (LRR) protein